MAAETARCDTAPVSHRPPHLIGISQLLTSVALLSSAWPLTKLALAAGSTPIWFAEGRSVLSGLTVAVLLALRGRLALPARGDWIPILAIGGGQIGGYYALAHEAVAWVPAGRTAILANTTTIWIVPLSLIFLHEAIPARRWLAAGLGLAGVAVLTNPWSIDWSSPPILIGHAFLLGAGLAWSISMIITRAVRPVSSLFSLMPWSFLVAAVMLAPLVWIHAPDGTLGRGGASWFALAYIGLLAGPIGTWCIVEATAKLPTVVSSVGFLLTPAISLVLANVVLEEPFTPDLLGGSALIMTGVVCAAWPERKPG